MKILSVAIPCYNSEAYMRKCIESLLPGGEDIEILVVDDGSAKDQTAAIADAYQEKYPTIVKAIHQENGGHGEAVNTGIANASGVYFKVVDSDDLGGFRCPSEDHWYFKRTDFRTGYGGYVHQQLYL